MYSNAKPIEEEFGCKGYFGLGSGIEMARDVPAPSFPGDEVPMYCNRCPVSQECWDGHKARVEGIFPDLCDELKRLVELYGDGARGAKMFSEKFGHVDPYISLLGSNVEDGQLIALGKPPQDRGKGTLVWPPTM